jgi:hypothetical protein
MLVTLSFARGDPERAEILIDLWRMHFMKSWRLPRLAA